MVEVGTSSSWGHRRGGHRGTRGGRGGRGGGHTRAPAFGATRRPIPTEPDVLEIGHGIMDGDAKTTICVVVRDNFMGPWTSWRMLEKKDWDHIWKDFFKYYKFAAGQETHGRKVVHEYIKSEWRKWMNESRSWSLAQRGLPENDKWTMEQLEHSPPWFSRHWEPMCREWATEEFNKKRAQGRSARSGVKVLYAGGAMTVEQHERDLEKRTGGPVTIDFLFEKCHKKKKDDGSWPNEITEEIGLALKEKIQSQEPPTGPQTQEERLIASAETMVSVTGRGTRNRIIGMGDRIKLNQLDSGALYPINRSSGAGTSVDAPNSEAMRGEITQQVLKELYENPWGSSSS